MEVLVDPGCVTGEGPIWNALDSRLYWADIERGLLYRYRLSDSRFETFEVGGKLGAMTIQADGSLLLFKEAGAVHVWREGGVSLLIAGLAEIAGTRFNDAIADPLGRVFVGTMPVEGLASRLYRLELDGTLTLVFDDLGQSNGMAFSLDNRRLFHSDTRKGVICSYAYDEASGELSGREVVFSDAVAGVPDGLTIDEAGTLYHARYGGGCLVKHGAGTIAVPTPNVTSVAFGGLDMKTGFVTSAGGDEKGKYGELAGAVFTFRSEVAGRGEYFSRVCL